MIHLKRVELVITGVLNDFESGSVSSISGIVQSEELKLEELLMDLELLLDLIPFLDLE